MTEYEIASLALEKAAGIRDQADLLQGQAELISNTSRRPVFI